MTAEHISPFSLLKIYEADVNRDLARITNMRYHPEAEKRKVMNNLKIITNPHLIIATDSGYRAGDIIESTHLIITKECEEDARKNGLLLPRHFVSATGFCLKMDSSTKYVRLDVMSRDSKKLPEYVEKLIEAGYTVIDAENKHVGKR